MFKLGPMLAVHAATRRRIRLTVTHQEGGASRSFRDILDARAWVRRYFPERPILHADGLARSADDRVTCTLKGCTFLELFPVVQQ